MTLHPLKILLFGLIISCSSNPNSDRLESREMYAFKSPSIEGSSDSLAFHRPYQLQILDQDTVLVYKYSYSVDSTKNMTFRFNTKSQVLTFGPFDLEKIKPSFFEHQELWDGHFDLYDLKIPVTDGNGPMLFNQKYGVLNVDNSYWAYHYLFLPDGEKSAGLAEQILMKLKEK